MKKFLLSLLCVAGFAGFATAEDSDLYTVQFGADYNSEQMSSYVNTWYVTCDNHQWNLENWNNNKNEWSYVKCGRKNNASVATITSGFQVADKITSVVLTIDKMTVAKVNSISLLVSSTDSFTDPAETVSANSEDFSANGCTLTLSPTAPAENMYYQLKFDCASGSGYGLIQLSKVVFKGEGAEVNPNTPAAPVLSMTQQGEGFVVSMTTETEGAAIYYTTDETTPDATSSKYTAPVEVWEKTTFKAIAISGDYSSSVTTFVADPPMILDGFGALNSDIEGEWKVLVNCPMTVIYKSGNYLYVKDNSGYYMLLYGSNSAELANGDTFSTLEGTFYVYKGLPEIKNYTMGEVTTGGAAVEPAVGEYLTQVAGNVLNFYYKFENIKISDVNGKNATMTDAEGNTAALYNQFGLDLSDLSEDQAYTVTGFVSIYNTNLQFQPTEIVAYEAPVTPTEPATYAGKLEGTMTNAWVLGQDETNRVDVPYTINYAIKYDADTKKVTVDAEFVLENEIVGMVPQVFVDGGYEGTMTEAAAATRSVSKNYSYTLTNEYEAGTEIKIGFYTAYNGGAAGPLEVEYTAGGTTTGVDSIATENGKAVYFNLNGVRVANPDNGIFIRVQDGKASKVLVK